MHLNVTNLTERLGVLHGSMDTINERLVRVDASGAPGARDMQGGGVFAGGQGGNESKSNLDLDMEGF